MTGVYFGTNRNPSPRNNPVNFGKHFSDDGLSNLRFGKAVVEGNKVTIEVMPERIAQASNVNITDDSSSVFGSNRLFDDLRKNMRQSGCETIVYIHGYNVTFKEAIKSAARLKTNFQDLNGGRGVNVLAFSWPSDGSMAPWWAYSSDRRDASVSGAAFARGMLKVRDFLNSMKEDEACDQSIHLLAHSMGNYVLRHAFQEVRRQSPVGLPRIFDQIFLMAADEDDDAFEHEHKLKLLPRIARHVNVYFNRGDTAMSISDKTKGNPDRLGDDGPRAPFQIPAKVSQIDCSKVVSGIVEHSYYVDEPKVVQDMMQVMMGVDPKEVVGRDFHDDRNRFVIRND